MGFISDLATASGIPEPGMRLLLGQLLGYLVMLVYRKLVSSQQSNWQHLYFTITGLLAAWFVIGEDVKHSIFVIFTTYLLLLAAGGTLTSVFISFMFNFGYLLVGYYFNESEGYDICWTTPHCVMTLRLIGLTFDLYDGDRARRKGNQVLSKDQEKSALEEVPSLLEIFSHNFFIGGYFVGPQIQMKKYKETMTPTYQDSLPSSPLGYGFKRLGLGCCYMLFHTVGAFLLPADWPASQPFTDSLLITKLVLLPFWCRILMAKYVAVWLIAEGVCVISGLRGCTYVKVSQLETSSNSRQLIESFNIPTNKWVSVYIYKRLKFLGRKSLSHAITLLFLAVWHGSHSGYYVLFLNEFLIIKLEREFLSSWRNSRKVERWNQSPHLSRLFTVFGWCWISCILPHAMIAFVLRTSSSYCPAYQATYFFLFLVLATCYLTKGHIKRFLMEENQ